MKNTIDEISKHETKVFSNLLQIQKCPEFCE